jgi:hypothetical protein
MTALAMLSLVVVLVESPVAAGLALVLLALTLVALEAPVLLAGMGADEE